MFGGQKTNTFGQPAQQQNTMGFGQQQPTFGQKLQTPFGQPQQNTFGAPQPAGGNLFGAPQQQQQPTPFFGASTPAASSKHYIFQKLVSTITQNIIKSIF